MVFRFLALAVLSLAAVTPAFAQAEQAVKPQATPPIFFPERVIKGEMEYAAAILKLTDAQKAELKKLDQDFTVTMAPSMEIYDMGGKLLFCLGIKQQGSGISDKQDQYVQAFKYYQVEKAEEQKVLWKQHSVAAVKVTYLDHALLDRHYEYIESAQKAAAEQMVDRAVRTGVYQHTSCAKVQVILDDTDARRKRAASSGILGTPAK